MLPKQFLLRLCPVDLLKRPPIGSSDPSSDKSAINHSKLQLWGGGGGNRLTCWATSLGGRWGRRWNWCRRRCRHICSGTPLCRTPSIARPAGTLCHGKNNKKTSVSIPWYLWLTDPDQWSSRYRTNKRLFFSLRFYAYPCCRYIYIIL